MRHLYRPILLLTVIVAGVSGWVLWRTDRALSPVPLAPLPGLDTGSTATAMRIWARELMADWARTQLWLRIRNHPMPEARPEVTGREAVALRELTTLGFKPLIFLRWDDKTWTHGIRAGGGQRLPLDLREAYQRAVTESLKFGGTGAAFEFENEPDISFVQENPETYLAFLKACFLGVKQGAEATRNFQHPTYKPVEVPLVVMAPLALPPGPYFEQMVANGLFSYTDAFNYHYYGYAEDFTGVYRQFAEAVIELGNVGQGFRTPPNGVEAGYGNPALQTIKRTLPVLLTEYGYGGLGIKSRDTVEGRIRQWRWFKSVAEDIALLRIAGPMAFYLPPYLENNQLEFGLSMRNVHEKHETGNLKPELLGNQSSGLKTQVSGLASHPSGLSFSPSDFGQLLPETWMKRIGQRFGENEATPALAWLLEEGARRPYTPKDWTVEAAEPSPVVIDFIAGDGLAQAKRYGGYVAQRFNPKPAPPPIVKPAWAPETPKPPKGPQELPPSVPGLPKGFIPPPAWFGTGAIILYNFSDQTLNGRLWIERGGELLFDASTLAREWTLAPMSRTVVEINLNIPALSFTRNELALRFTHEKPETEGQKPEIGNLKPVSSETSTSDLMSQVSGLVSVFSTAFFPNYPLMWETVVYDFTDRNVGLHPGASPSGNNEGTNQRPAIRGNSAIPPFPGKVAFGDAALQLASEEPRLTPAGRWRVTPGVSVDESVDRIWRFRIEGFPSEPEKSPIAELTLPDDFEFPAGAMLRFSYRLAQPAGTTIANGKYMEAYFRTANGNLYQVWPRQYAMDVWSDYTEVKENYTMAFYGRANLPWRFKDNRPVALVFFFRPGRESLPAVYELSNPRIVRLDQQAR